MKVLLASDGSDSAEAAALLVEGIADRAHVEVTVVSVVPHPQIPSPLFDAVLPPKIADDTAADLRQVGFKADSLVANGPPGAEIVRLVEEGNFDLTVMGAGTKSWLGNVLVGSVSMYVLHSSPSSTLIVHEFPAGRERLQVLIGADGSNESKVAIDLFSKFADPRRCDTVVASVVHPIEGLTHPYPIPGSPRERELKQRLAEKGGMIAEEGADQLRRAAFTARPTVLTGTPSTQLLKEAANLGTDLVVVGSRGHGPVGRALMGSVSDAVSRHSRAALVGRRLRN